MGTRVRVAELGDIDYTTEQLKAFSKFYGSKRALFPNDEECKAKLKNLVEHHLFFIAERDGAGPVGFIIGMVAPHAFNESLTVLTELFWWVEEDYRNSRAGLILFNEFIKWGQDNVDWISFALESHSPVNKDLLLKRGFKHQETVFLMEN